MWKGLKIEVHKMSLPILQKYIKMSEKEYMLSLLNKTSFSRLNKTCFSDIN